MSSLRTSPYSRRSWRAWHYIAPDEFEQRERKRLERLLAALLVAFMAVMLAAVSAYGFAHPDRKWRYPEYLVMNVQDAQLLTDEEKAIARKTGIAHFYYDGGIYAMDDLPEQYYEWHE